MAGDNVSDVPGTAVLVIFIQLVRVLHAIPRQEILSRMPETMFCPAVLVYCHEKLVIHA